MIIDGKEANSAAAYKAGYNDSLNGKPCDTAAMNGALSGHYTAGYVTGRMKARADNRRVAAQYSSNEIL